MPRPVNGGLLIIYALLHSIVHRKSHYALEKERGGTRKKSFLFRCIHGKHPHQLHPHFIVVQVKIKSEMTSYLITFFLAFRVIFHIL